MLLLGMWWTDEQTERQGVRQLYGSTNVVPSSSVLVDIVERYFCRHANDERDEVRKCR